MITVLFKIITLLYIFVVAATIVVVVLEKRQPVKTMAWTLVLIALPVAGILLFYFFGQDVRKERKLQRKEIKSLKQQNLARYLPIDYVEPPKDYVTLCRFFVQRNYAPLFALQDVDIYNNGEDKTIALIRDIAAAKNSINMEYFIFADDAVGHLVSDCLIDAVKRGVTVRLLYDDVGCWSVSNKFFKQMAQSGVIVSTFMSVRFPSLTRRMNYRNHRKLVIIDGRIGYIGGMNIANRYLYGKDGKGWRDMHMRLTGNAVYGLQQTFASDWIYNGNKPIEDDSLYPAPSDKRPSSGALQIVTSSPASEAPFIMNGFVWAMLNARKYFYLATPYLMPTEQVLNALKISAGAGIDVRIMVPAKSEHFWIKAANESYYGELLRAGIKIYAYGPGFMHAKYFVSDDMLSTVGSTNTDFRSFEDDFEVNAFIYDRATTMKLKSAFEKDIDSCTLITQEIWRKRSRTQRIVESFVRILSPLL